MSEELDEGAVEEQEEEVRPAYVYAGDGFFSARDSDHNEIDREEGFADEHEAAQAAADKYPSRPDGGIEIRRGQDPTSDEQQESPDTGPDEAEAEETAEE